MSVIKAKLLFSKDQNFMSRHDISVSRTEHQMDSSDSSLRTSSELKQLVNIFQEFVTVNKKQAEAHATALKLQQFSDMQPRDRPITIPLPSQDTQLSKQSLQKYMTTLCSVVWSKAFQYYSTNQLSFQNTKIYCSQQILQNLIKLSQKYNLKPQSFECINDHLQKNILEYMLNKYPMTLSQEINRNLNNSIREIDDTDKISNNFLYKSEVNFKYRESGEYNDLIMRTFNEVIIKVESKTENKTVYERFEDKMMLLFESITDYEWMHNQQPFPEEEHDSRWLLNNTITNVLQKKTTLDENLLKNQYIKIKEKEKSSYEEKVRQYTTYKIGKKLPESTRLFTEEEIKSHRLKIQNPQILRILTKWCEELERKFENTDYFEHFISAFSLEKSTFLSMMKVDIRDSLSQLISEEKEQIQVELSELAKNNYYMQSELLMRKLISAEFNQIERYERISAQLSIDIVNNLHSYIISYLNRLIHGLLKVFKKFQQLPISQQLEMPSNESIISFQIMDLIRCKCSSKEKQIIKLYHEIVKYCEQNSNMHLVRVVNRLKKGTNDILINIKYRDVLCEIQLAVANKNNTFLEYSNAFNHYLYQLKRSVFGPLTELCGIWKNLDSRFNIYQALKHHQADEKIPLNNHNCCEKVYVPYSKPFICTLCCQHYFHNKFIKKHIKCKDCEFWICARCQIDRSNCNQLLGAAFNSDQIIKKCKKLERDNKSIPNYGMCIYIQSQEIVIEPFRKYKNKHNTKIIGVNNKIIYQIYDISTEKQAERFMSKFLIFELEEDYGKRHIKISEESVKQHFTTQKFMHTLSKNKDTINLNNESLTNAELEKLCKIGKQQQRNRIKNFQLIANQLTSCDSIVDSFKNVSKLELSKNRINSFGRLKELKKLEKINLNNNDIKEFPVEICDIDQIKEISLNQNSIKVLPPALEKCYHITSIQVAFNKLSDIPGFVFEYRNLVDLNAASNFLKEIPQAIGSSRKLRCLALQNNYIKQIPAQIKYLVDLQRLNLSHNKIDAIPSLSTLKSLKHLNLRHNNISNIDNLVLSTLNVKEIDMSYNRLTSIVNVDFPRLKFLNLNHNQLISFPTFTKSCSHLKHLLISNNKLTKMGSLQTLPNLQELQLNENFFEELHPSLCKLEKLLILHLQSNKLRRVNNLQMQSLVRMQLKRNKISEVKGSHMKNLEELDLSENELISFEFNFLPKLKKINVNINQLVKLELNSYHRISNVQAARNKLITVPTFHENNQIKVLNLEHNYIQEIPRPMLASTHIKSLNLSSNRIRVIPQDLQNLNLKEKSLFLQNNPVETVECLNFILKCGGCDLNLQSKAKEKVPQTRDEIIMSETKIIERI